MHIHQFQLNPFRAEFTQGKFRILYHSSTLTVNTMATDDLVMKGAMDLPVVCLEYSSFTEGRVTHWYDTILGQPRFR